MAFEAISMLEPLTGSTDIGNAVAEGNRDLANVDDQFLISMPCKVDHVVVWSNNAATANFTIQFTSYIDGVVGTLGDCGQVTVPAGAAALHLYVDRIGTAGPALPIGSRVLVHVSDAGDSGDSGFYLLGVEYSPELILDSSGASLSS